MTSEAAKVKRITFLVHPEEWDDATQFDETTHRRVDTIKAGSVVGVELVLDAHQLRTFGFNVYEKKPDGITPCLAELALGSVFASFRGAAKHVSVAPAYPETHPALGGLLGLSVELDCGLPVRLVGRFSKADTLFNLSGNTWSGT